MDQEPWRLGPEGNRLDALAAMNGIAGSLAVLVGKRRRPRQKGDRAVQRQESALIALAGALAGAFRRQDAPGFALDAEGLVALMAQVEACAARGVRHDQLVEIPARWSFDRLTIDPARLALVATMRLRQKIEVQLTGASDARRLTQLQVVKNLEGEIARIAQRLDRREIAGAEALRIVIDRFVVAAGAVTPADIGELLSGDPRRSPALPCLPSRKRGPSAAA